MVHTCRPRRPLSNRSPESVKSGSILENEHPRAICLSAAGCITDRVAPASRASLHAPFLGITLELTQASAARACWAVDAVTDESAAARDSHTPHCRPQCASRRCEWVRGRRRDNDVRCGTPTSLSPKRMNSRSGWMTFAAASAAGVCDDEGDRGDGVCVATSDCSS